MLGIFYNFFYFWARVIDYFEKEDTLLNQEKNSSIIPSDRYTTW